MKNLLTFTLSITLLYACGGELKLHDNTPADTATTTELSTLEYASVEEMEADNKTARERAPQSTGKKKTNSAIRMAQEVARSMF